MSLSAGDLSRLAAIVPEEAIGEVIRIVSAAFSDRGASARSARNKKYYEAKKRLKASESVTESASENVLTRLKEVAEDPSGQGGKSRPLFMGKNLIKESKTLSPPSHRLKTQSHLFDPEPVRMLADRWNGLAVMTDHIDQILDIIPDLERDIKKCLPLLVRGGMDMPTAIASYFDRIERSDWLMGRTGTFKLTIDWVVTPKNCDKILRGNYENRTQAKAEPRPNAGYGAHYGRELSGSGKRVSEAWRDPVRD